MVARPTPAWTIPAMSHPPAWSTLPPGPMSDRRRPARAGVYRIFDQIRRPTRIGRPPGRDAQCWHCRNCRRKRGRRRWWTSRCRSRVLGKLGSPSRPRGCAARTPTSSRATTPRTRRSRSGTRSRASSTRSGPGGRGVGRRAGGDGVPVLDLRHVSLVLHRDADAVRGASIHRQHGRRRFRDASRRAGVHLHRIPDWVGDHAAALAEPLACVCNAMLDPNAITGLTESSSSAPGRSGCWLARSPGPAGGRVLLSVSRPTRTAGMAASLGFEVCRLDRPEDLARFDEEVAATPIDVVIECSGDDRGVATALPCSARRAR